MRKSLVLILSLVVLVANADVNGMAQDILAQVIHGPVNADPEISDSIADQTVVVSLRSAALNLACKQKNRGDDNVIASCIAKNKPELLTVGNLSESSFNVGQQAAIQQAKIHREVGISNYISVATQLVTYANNITNQSSLSIPNLSGQ